MKKAFTLLELLVVVLILGLLATIAVGVFTAQVERAKVAAARSTISAMELAIERYQIDTGEYPPSGSGTLPYTVPAPGNYVGCGYMQVALMSSLSGQSTRPLSPRWQGPYLTVKNDILGDINGIRIDDTNLPSPILPGQLQVLDPWQLPYRYNRSKSLVNPDDFTATADRYENNGGTVLPGTHPFSTTETFFNPNTFQIISAGPDNTTLASPDSGLEKNDVTNLGM